jgi:hypothetical protein
MPIPHGNAGPQAQPSHGEVKTHIPPGVSPDNDLFLSMFLVRLPSSMRETVGAGNYMTATAMVKARMPCRMLEMATTLQSRPPGLSEVGALLPTAGGEATNGAVMPAPKVTPPPSHPDFHSFQNPGNGVCKFHNYYANRANRCAQPCARSENWFATEPFLVRQPIQHTPLPRRCISQPMQDSFSSRTTDK